MSPRIPIGEPEGQRLEFKPRAALERPEAIVRSVVGMLNAEGGEVWIGVRSEAGLGVELEGVDDAERARQRLQEALCDRIEPTPGLDEARVEVVRSGRDLLRVEVRPIESHRPYAAILGPGREYPVRMAAVSRNLSREEIRALFAGAPAQTERGREETSAAARRLAGEQRRVLESGRPVLWIGAVLDGGGELDLAAVAESGLLTEPQLSGSHLLYSWPAALRGAALTGQLRASPRSVSGRSTFCWETPWGDAVSLDRAGGLFAGADIDQFATGPLPGAEGPFLYPDRFVGWVVSPFRILARLTSQEGLWRDGFAGGDSPVFASLLVTGIAGWRLAPGRLPRSEPLRRRTAGRAARIDRDFVSSSTFSLTVETVRDEPDRCAFRLLARFYEAFGLSESDVPYFDPRTERFDWSLPEPL